MHSNRYVETKCTGRSRKPVRDYCDDWGAQQWWLTLGHHGRGSNWLYSEHILFIKKFVF